MTVSLGPYDWATNQGNGTTESPYIIETAGQLDSLAGLFEGEEASSVRTSHFALANDIDM